LVAICRIQIETHVILADGLQATTEVFRHAEDDA
jgi:hypothetical protein